MENQLKKLLGIEVPIIQGGMAWISEANLASAVSNAGGAGIISTGGRTTEYTRDEIRRCRTLTDRPFGVNVMLMAPNRDEIVDVICEEKPAFVTLGAGNPVPYFEKLHAAGVKVIPVVPSVKLAKRVEEKGADAIVVEGMDAGDVYVKLARCCTPMPGDPIVGFITRGSGISVHRRDCQNVEQLQREPERIVPVSWAANAHTAYRVQIDVEAAVPQPRLNTFEEQTRALRESLGLPIKEER